MQIHYYRDIDGTLTDMSQYAPRLNWIAQSKAEEGAYGSWTVTLDDPNSDLNVVGHRQWFVEDDESEDEDDIIFGGFTGGQTLARIGEDQRRPIGPLARIITLELLDANTWFSKILMRGSDCNRPVETDVQRMQWLLGTSEAGLIVDTTTFVDTTGGVQMDKADLRGTYFGQAVADCASASGKNYFLWYRKVAGIRTLTIWYAKDSVTDYPSPFYITNDRDVSADPDGIADGSIIIRQLSADAQLVRSPERQYCGNYVTYGDKGAAVYRHSASNHAIIASYGSGHRDMTSNFPLVKTKAKAQARGDRQLLDVHPQDLRITDRVVNLPSTQVSLLKAGKRVQINGTHWYPQDGWHYARIVTAQPKPHSKGDLYDVDLELVMGDESSGPPAPPFTGDAFAGIQGSTNDNSSGGGRGVLCYGSPYHPAGAGWDDQADTGPLSTNAPDGSGRYHGVTASQSMYVRIYARAWYNQTPGHDTKTLRVYVNGVQVGASSASDWINYLTVDLRNYPISAGDVITIDGTPTFWSNSGVNGTQLIVGRGNFPGVNLAGTGTHFVGP